MPVYIDDKYSGKTSSVFVIKSSDETLKTPEEYSDYRLQAARRQSRMTKYISQVEEGDDLEKESDLDKVIFRNRKYEKNVKHLVEKKEKELKENWGKLKLVFKEEDYIMSEKPQVCLQKLLDQRKAQKSHLVFQRQQRAASPKISHDLERESRRCTLTLTTHTSRSDPEKPSDFVSQSRMSTDTQAHEEFNSGLQTNRNDSTTPTITSTTSATKLPRSISRADSTDTQFFHAPSVHMPIQGTLPRIEELREKKPSMSYASTPSTPHKSKMRLRRGRNCSRNFFATRKATGNEESNLFMFSQHMESRGLMEEIEKKKKRLEMQNDKSNIFLNPTLARKKIERRYRGALRVIPELRRRFSAESVVKAFISEQFLGLRLKGPRSILLRKIYDFSIMKQNSVSKLIIKHPEMLPTRIFKDLLTYKKQFEVAPVYVSTHSMEGESLWRDFFEEDLAVKGNCILDELEHDIPLYPNFYKNLIIARADNIKVSEQLIKERKKLSLREIIVHITLQLRMSRHVPGSSARVEMMSVMAASAYNEKLLTMLALSVDDWLDQLVKCLGSNFKSVREETCQILCYMTTSYPLMKALYISKYFDVVSDLGTSLLKFMEIHEDTFEDYFIVLVHLMHYTPSRGLLDCIFDRHLLFKNVELTRRWPQLAYYAFKYWPDDPLAIRSVLFGKRVINILENALQKPLTRKFARAALYHFQLRYDPISRIFTIFSDKAEKAYLIALGLLE